MTGWLDLIIARLAASAGIGAAVGVGVAFAVPGSALFSVLSGWIATSAVFCASTWLLVRDMDAASVREHASREDPGRAVGDLVLLVACIAGVVGVGVLLLAGSSPGTGRALDALVGVLAVVASWFGAHLLYMLRYARQHTADPARGIDFEGGDPTYRDFAYVAYVAYTIGMTYQVSDTGFRSRALRSTALGHALLSYFLGAVVIACTINLVVQLASAH